MLLKWAKPISMPLARLPVIQLVKYLKEAKRMKVKIGPYPYRLTSNIFKDYMTNKYGFDWPAEYTRFERSLEWLDDKVQAFYNIFNRLYFDEREQKVSVKIDRWDTWSMDHTLADIILPMLIQLKETKHGAPNVDDEDVPAELQSKYAVEPGNSLIGTTDSNWFARWDWVMDEMIFAFANKVDDSWEEQFSTGEMDIVWEKLPNGYSEMKHGPNHTYETDWDGRKAYQERISNGFRLFGKYYENLWD